MIYGIGTDIVEIDRIKKIRDLQSFCRRFFSAAENELFSRPERIAANYAAKEAFSKAIGTGMCGFALKEVEVLRDNLGKPFIRLSGKAEALARSLIVHVTVSHSDKYATAFVVLEKRDINESVL